MLTTDQRALVAVAGSKDLCILPRMANRHGLITGATGTGKTITLQTLAENFSQLGVPVFLADIKGDLSGIARPGMPAGKVAERIASLGLGGRGYTPQAFPVSFWDVFGKQGHPLRTTVSEMGPLLLSRLLQLNDVQSGLLQLVFKIADDSGLLLLDMKDLRSMLQHVADHRQEYQTYGNIASATVGAIQRGLVALESEGGALFFGEPALNLADLMQTDARGRGVINILAADALVNSPRIYSSLLLWLLSELFERLPECGDMDKPRLIFFFDEAHLLFDSANPALLQKIEQVVRLIRSRGVGIYFVSQNPSDIPDRILGQLGNRVQHALRAFTPKDRKAVKAAAQSFRPNPAFDTESAIGELGVGEALVSLLDEKGSPQVVERAYIVPPQAQIGPITLQERQQVIRQSSMAGIYEHTYDRESAYEILMRRALEQPPLQSQPRPRAGRQAQAAPQLTGVDALLGTLAKQATRTVTNTIGREIGKTLIRGVLGSLFGGKR